MNYPKEPPPPTRSKLWHDAHTQAELKIYEREWEEYLKNKLAWRKIIEKN